MSGKATLNAVSDHSAVLATGLTKQFDEVVALDAVDLDVEVGELLAVLGPSGCGKTTLLRVIAGLEVPDAGTVAVAGRVVAGPDDFVRPEARRIGLVFQDYALFPHLTVAENVGYGVRERRRRRARVPEVLQLVGLTSLADRLPHELSGGQQQRVALGRALAPEPAIVLLDEPFSSLDAAMRARVREDVRDILERAGATAIFVTHDQEEALSIADRVAVMEDGRVLQLDDPTRVYAQPLDRFVATFVGDADVVSGTSDGAGVATALGRLTPLVAPDPGPVDVILRPERLRLRLDGGGEGTVRHTTYFGHDQLVRVELADGAIVHARMGPGTSFEPGDRVAVNVTGEVLAFAPAPADGTGTRPAGHGGFARRHGRRRRTRRRGRG